MISAHLRNAAALMLLLLVLPAMPAQVSAGVTPSELEQCARIASRGERIACFDDATREAPEDRSQPASQVAEKGPVPDIIRWVRGMETTRRIGDPSFHLSRIEGSGTASGDPLVIAAPSLGPDPSHAYLVVSCVSRITRLQIIPVRRMEKRKATIGLRVDGTPMGEPSAWQVLGGGLLVDAGRGLPAIDAVRALRQGSRLSVSSDDPLLNGLVFDAAGLSELIAEQRKACRW